MADGIAIGTTLGDTYQVVRLLGRGGMGAVWEAHHLRLPGKRVAVKVLHGERAADSAIYARFRREAEIASRLGHENIIEALDFNTLPDGTPYIVLEFLEGETLGARIRRGAIPVDEALGITRQIGSALAAAHRAGVVHRDLKPENIFLCPTERGGEVGVRVKVLDFGISKIRDSQSVVTTDHTVLGTPQYMSPEQASAKHGDVDGRTDQFALGAIVYEMLSGVAAFAGPTMVSVIYKVMTEQPEPLPKVRPQCPTRVAVAVERALSKDPRQRFADIPAFVEALTGRPLQTLDKARALEPTLVDPASPTSLAETRPRSSVPRGALVFAGVAFVAALAAVTALMVRRTPGSTGGLPPAGGPATVATRPGEARPTTVEPAGTGAAAGSAAPTTIGASGAVPAAPAAAPTPPVTTVFPTPGAGSVARPPTGAPPADAPQPRGPVAGGSTRAVGATSAVPPEALADLQEAEAALATGNADEAIRLSRRSLTAGRSARAYSVIARAFCRKGDLGNARAQLPHVGGERARVLRECHASGTDLQ